jgi:hypothetical protein
MHFRAQVEAFESDFVHRAQIVFLRMGKLEFTGLCSMDVKLHIGELVHVDMDPERLYFFDTKSGKRL